jgi:hypothetical protein
MYLIVVRNQKTSISLADFPAAKLQGNPPSKVWVNHVVVDDDDTMSLAAEPK